MMNLQVREWLKSARPMPNTRTPNAVRLEFAPDSLVHNNLSGAAFTGN